MQYLRCVNVSPPGISPFTLGISRSRISCIFVLAPSDTQHASAAGKIIRNKMEKMKTLNKFKVKKRIEVVIDTEVQKFDKKINLHTGTQTKVWAKIEKNIYCQEK